MASDRPVGALLGPSRHGTPLRTSNAPLAHSTPSTRQQQRSGLGIEAQRATIARFAEAEGLTIIAEYVEAETGKGADALDRRPQLAAALVTAKSAKCCVLVSRLDRLPQRRRILPRRSGAKQVKGRRARKTFGVNLGVRRTRNRPRLARALTVTTPAEYRQLALDCMREAEHADDVAMRLTMVGLARAWMGVALELDKCAIQPNDDPRGTTAPTETNPVWRKE